MAVLKIYKFPNPTLRNISQPLKYVTHHERKLLDDMLETMYVNQGIGLAAPQVGILKRIVVLDIGEGPMQLINPVITKKTEWEQDKEGCLSLPEVMVEVKRAKKIEYKALDRDAKPVEGKAEGLLAKAIQHEIDHLNGKLIIDYANPIKKFFLKKKLLKKTRYC